MCHHHAIPYLSLAPLHFNVLLKKFQFILLISSNFLLGPYSTPTHNSRHLLLLLKYLLIFYFTFFIFSFSLQYITVSDQLWKFVCANFLIIILDLILSSTKSPSRFVLISLTTMLWPSGLLLNKKLFSNFKRILEFFVTHFTDTEFGRFY
ncbi:hypothetical protein EYC84_007836 [Monilinia fructicola]|uniref:Uncharacterized protein n=1 Tax=Monilinia fructicola TaxID=38448 RepID=A0A5M9JJE4_MONFR|nr:hypothetical protein EYC84_007836 [Monilinia fructicola]